jgi:cytochrome c553
MSATTSNRPAETKLMRRWPIAQCLAALLFFCNLTQAAENPASPETSMRAMLDAPLLFVKRHSYTGIHIYDTYYKWPPGGGGIYILENPAAPPDQQRVRALIDPTTPETLGLGVYSHPELSWDAQRVMFCFKGQPQGNTSIYEIGIDGRNLRRITDPAPTCVSYKGSQSGQHDVAPAYLPDGRIVFLSTRPSGLVPCNNTGVATLHVMNADGSDIHPISVNFVNEFDPAVLHDGRLLFGRWEYVDKNALTIQSLWTSNPDGTQETAFYANNMVLPEAILDARPVPDSTLIVGTLAKHNAPPRGSIAFIDSALGKNNPKAIANLEHPDQPTYDLGESCEPWPLSDQVVIFSGRPAGAKRNVLEMMNRSGQRFTLLADPEICLHSPMLVKPRPVPPVIQDSIERDSKVGRFLVQDLYRGLDGVRPGEVRWLRVLEETSRVSASTMGGSPYNQTFLVSAALAFSTKHFLGLVPVEEDGSAYFEAPAGKALFLQALDADKRLVQSMRTFVQASPGATRSCVGCHEHKSSTPALERGIPRSLARQPSTLQPETWGGGYLDYPSMVQPVLDRHCVRCHGGEEGIAAGLDLTGGWTEHFNISYENLVSRRESQLVAYLISGIDCMNGTAFWSCQIFPPRGHGSGSAPLAKLLLSGHDKRIADLSRRDRDLLLAWIDSNGLYHGTWDSTESGCATKGWQPTREALLAQMREAGCARCHAKDGKPLLFEEDWINLRQPEMSRILRAPLPQGGPGHGLGFCRDRQVDPQRQRIRQLVSGYAHAVQPVEAFARRQFVPPDRSGSPVVSFASTDDPQYQAMLAIIRRGQQLALATPRVDMPGAKIVAGTARQFVPPTLPKELPTLQAEPQVSGGVLLSWDQRSDLAGLTFELHRGAQPDFVPDDTTRLLRTTRFSYLDPALKDRTLHYALVLVSDSGKSEPIRRSVGTLALHEK